MQIHRQFFFDVPASETLKKQITKTKSDFHFQIIYKNATRRHPKCQRLQLPEYIYYCNIYRNYYPRRLIGLRICPADLTDQQLCFKKKKKQKTIPCVHYL